MMKKIAYVSGTRADFGLMTPVLRAVQKSKKLKLQLYATGMHLMPRFGKTINEVRNFFPAAKHINAVFETDDRFGMALFAGALLSNIVSVFNKNRPDIVLILGDRVEMLATAMAAIYLGIPIAHIHGGEKTYTVDEVARHAISKLSHLHFVSTKDSAKRLVKMGEQSWRIHVVGAPGLDTILQANLVTRDKVCNFFKIDPSQKILLVTMHPMSETVEDSGYQMQQV